MEQDDFLQEVLATRQSCLAAVGRAVTTRAPIDVSLNEMGREKGERDCLVDLSDAAALAACGAFGTGLRIGHEFVEPATPACNKAGLSNLLRLVRIASASYFVESLLFNTCSAKRYENRSTRIRSTAENPISVRL